MYIVTFDGFDMKAKTEKEVRSFFSDNSVDAAFIWSDLRSEGFTASFCGTWSVSKAYASEVKDMDLLSNYSWIDGLMDLNS